jgi:hypothetical protein
MESAYYLVAVPQQVEELISCGHLVPSETVPELSTKVVVFVHCGKKGRTIFDPASCATKDFLRFPTIVKVRSPFATTFPSLLSSRILCFNLQVVWLVPQPFIP